MSNRGGDGAEHTERTTRNRYWATYVVYWIVGTVALSAVIIAYRTFRWGNSAFPIMMGAGDFQTEIGQLGMSMQVAMTVGLGIIVLWLHSGGSDD